MAIVIRLKFCYLLKGLIIRNVLFCAKFELLNFMTLIMGGSANVSKQVNVCTLKNVKESTRLGAYFYVCSTYESSEHRH